MSDIQFAPASEDDFEGLLEIRIATMRESLERLGRFHPDRARERFRSSFEPRFMRLVHERDAFVGCVTVRPLSDGAMEVEHFYIAPEHQSRGLGAAIMRLICDEADAAGKLIRLGVLRESDANRFYVRHGFFETHREEWDIYYTRPPALPSPR